MKGVSNNITSEKDKQLLILKEQNDNKEYVIQQSNLFVSKHFKLLEMIHELAKEQLPEKSLYEKIDEEINNRKKLEGTDQKNYLKEKVKQQNENDGKPFLLDRDIYGQKIIRCLPKRLIASLHKDEAEQWKAVKAMVIHPKNQKMQIASKVMRSEKK